MIRTGRLLFFLAAPLLLAASAAEAAKPGDPVYLFTFFRDPNGYDGLHLAWSRDGYRWDELGPVDHPWITSSLGAKCLRDPCLRQGPDGVFHLVWTTGWGDKGIGYAHSTDLIHWSEPAWLPVNEKVDGAKNTWAPELFYDAKSQQWLIFWATTIEGRFPETANGGDGNHRQYYVTTKDFKSFSETKLLFDPGHNCIDATMLEVDGRYHLIYKDERPGKKELHLTTSATPEGPWGPASPPLPKPGEMVEGPSAIRIGEEYFVYFDVYTNNRYGAVKSRDLIHWEDITPKLFFPAGFKHGTVLQVSEAMFQSLLAEAYPPQQATIGVALDRPGVKISPTLYGIFFEEINFAGDGGLYAELVRNRSFEDSDKPDHWTLVTNGTAKGEMAVDTSRPASAKNRRSLRLSLASGGEGSVGAANAGYLGIALAQGATYDLSLLARAENAAIGPMAVRLESADGKQVYAQGQVEGLSSDWKPFRLVLTSNATDPKAHLVVSIFQPGTVWLDMVSLFPRKTWKDRPNGLRPDLAGMLDGLKPAFVRFPGGCWVEGDKLEFASRWKRTIGDLSERWTQWNLWQYHVTNGLGFHEYLQMCEDLGAEPLFVINCGMSHKENVSMDQMGEWVEDALDAIEYANSPVESKWGALRAKAGHPAPFGLKYMEIGNENGGPAYNERYALFYDAIKARYPQMNLIANVWNGVPGSRPVEILDEHYYSNPEFFLANATRYDTYDRKGPKIYVGEYAVTEKCGTGNLRGAVGEAAFMIGMERNSDIVIMSSYAPLFAHVDYKHWNPDMINFDGARVYGTPSYYVQKLFSTNRGDVVLPTTVAVAKPRHTPNHQGAVGLSTWGTQAEFKDIKVTKGDQVLFASDFARGSDGWKFLRGDWKTHDGALAQTNRGHDMRAVAGDSTWTDYTYSLKARKLGGSEGFLIMFQVRDENNWVWWNLGGWNNQRHGLEQCLGGQKSNLGNHIPGQIEAGRWYDIRIELSGTRIRCYLDGKLIHDVTSGPSQSLHAIASRQEATGDVILKVVNASPAVCETELTLTGGVAFQPMAKATVLTSASPEDENSLDQPTKVAPKAETIPVGPSFRHTFPPCSVTILRLEPRP